MDKQDILNSEEYDIRTFFKHAKDGDEIQTFAIVFNEKANFVQPPKNGKLVPFVEDLGGTFQHWIVILDHEGKEVARHNTQDTALITWKE